MCVQSRGVVNDDRPHNLVVKTLPVLVPQTPQLVEHAHYAEQTTEAVNRGTPERASPSELGSICGKWANMQLRLSERSPVPGSRNGLVRNEDQTHEDQNHDDRQLDPSETWSGH
jgi:hypothetical protein